MKLNEKKVWLIGASTGIGEELTYLLSNEVKELYISSRSSDKLENLKDKINKNIHAYPCDISQLESIKTTYNLIKSEAKQIDTIILNAAVYYPSTYSNFNLNEHIEQINTNYLGNLNLVSLFLDDFINSKSGHIVVISSQSAFKALPRASGYGASKAALTYFFESLRMEVEDLGINISIIYPGFVKTRLTEKNDFKMPFIMDANTASKIIMKIIRKGSGDISFPLKLSIPIQLLIRLPEIIYRKIIKKLIL